MVTVLWGLIEREIAQNPVIYHQSALKQLFKWRNLSSVKFCYDSWVIQREVKADFKMRLFFGPSYNLKYTLAFRLHLSVRKSAANHSRKRLHNCLVLIVVVLSH